MSASAPKYDLDGLFDPKRAAPFDAHSLLMARIPPGSRVLELGCATGYLSGYMERALGCRVTGLDYDAASVAVAAGRCAEAYQADLDAADGLASAQAGAPYDVVLAAAVLEHVKFPQAVLRGVRPLMAPGARLIVSLPNIAHWRSRLSLLLGRFDYTDYGLMDRTHVHFYTLKTARALLAEQGYRVSDVAVAGSLAQNAAGALAQCLHLPPPPLIAPGLLGYELILTAS